VKVERLGHYQEDMDVDAVNDPRWTRPECAGCDAGSWLSLGCARPCRYRPAEEENDLGAVAVRETTPAADPLGFMLAPALAVRW
jgi:hypothetical protein